ncbi:single-stranded DNA-binding protein [Crocosphaera sp. UHCC 0190]|uniref:single-stranded DNA-binding protein n=1 Tax=Crocosphaera sp. UHCC 0190 TaxID=3110246 RepID=UPI002B209A3F|nr:single-stranded DNA-binding protein [Crocosphaera sp. UHCC 0190]MEA5508712.1 single-stranded DNA-binding protein [Crocosphaera sp. UHCC 0190]
MNSFVLMAKVIRSPELRYTQDSQKEVAQMLVEFEGRRTEDPSATLKVVGWGNLATQMKETCHEGDRVIIEGRLSMNTFERKEGFKEKRAELVVSHIYPLDSHSVTAPVDNVIPFDTSKSSAKTDSLYTSDFEEEEGLESSSTVIDSDSSNGGSDPIPF